MRTLMILIVIVVLGAAVLAPMIAMLDLEPVKGDFAFDYNHQHFRVPVAYSLCASSVMALLYYFFRR